MVRAIVLSALLVSVSLPVLGADSGPRFRHVNYVAFEAKPSQTVEIRLQCIQAGKYQDVLKYRVLNPKSEPALAGEIEIGGSKSVAYTAQDDGLHVLELDSGWNTAGASLSVPYAIVSHEAALLRTMGVLDRLWFYVPTHVERFTVFLQAGVRGEGLAYRICDPEGRAVSEGAGDYDKCEKITLLVPQGADGKAWSLSILPPDKPGMGLDDTEVYLGGELAPYLAPKPEWAVHFGKRRHP